MPALLEEELTDGVELGHNKNVYPRRRAALGDRRLGQEPEMAGYLAR